MPKNWCMSWFETSGQNCIVNQNWGKTLELQSTTVMFSLLDCQIMNIYCIMKMWWHLEQSHLTLFSCASVSPLSTNAFCSKECILKDSGRNVSQSRHCLRARVISDWFSEFWRAHTHAHTQIHTQGCSILHYLAILTHPFGVFFLFHSASAPFSSKYFCWFTLARVAVLEVAETHYHEREAWPVGRCLPPHYQMQMKRVHMFNI